MSLAIYTDKENGSLSTPAPAKNRVRLQSAPDLLADRCLKTPHAGKLLTSAPALSARKTVNALGSVPSVPLPVWKKEPRVGSTKPKEEVKACPRQVKKEEYPEVEKMIPYNPLEFECFDVPEEQRLSHLCLAGLAVPPTVEEEEDDFHLLDVCMQLSPLTLPKKDWSAELDSFLQTVSELTVDLPPMEFED